MSDAVILALIGACVSTIASLIAAWVSVSNGRKVDAVVTKVEAVDARVEAVHVATNGLTEKLKDAALAAGRAEGHATGIQDQKREEAIKQNGRAEGVRDEKVRRSEAGEGLAKPNADPVAVKVVAPETLNVKVMPDKT